MVSCGISTSFPVLFPTERKVAHALLTRPPLEHLPKYLSPLDLHVLSTPPAFVLSQDQTLSFNPVYFFPVLTGKTQLIRNYCLIILRYSVCIVFKVQCSPAVSRASQLGYLIKLTKESQHLFYVFFDFFTKFSFFRTTLLHRLFCVRLYTEHSPLNCLPTVRVCSFISPFCPNIPPP